MRHSPPGAPPTTKLIIKKMAKECPTMSNADIARALGVSRQRVFAVVGWQRRRLNFTKPP